MKKLLTLILLTAVSFVSHAIPTDTWTDYDNFKDVKLVHKTKCTGWFNFVCTSTSNEYSYTHDLTRDGFVVGEDKINSASLSIGWYDDSFLDGSEWAHIDLPELVENEETKLISHWFFGKSELGMEITGLAQLTLDGFLNVTLTSAYGDFFVKDSTLTAHGEKGALIQTVPTPATFALFALAIAGFSVAKRKRRIG